MREVAEEIHEAVAQNYADQRRKFKVFSKGFSKKKHWYGNMKY